MDELSRRTLKWLTCFSLPLASGMRREELCGLEWKHISFEKDTMARRIFDKFCMRTYLCITSGMLAANVAAYHGHSSTKMTLDRYGHAVAEYRSKCADIGATVFSLKQTEAQ